MSFDTSRWNEPATRSELADTCMATALGLRSVTLAFQAIQLKQHDDLAHIIKQLTADADKLSSMFDELSGYKREDGDSE